jgi:hypothetical protein
MAVSASYQFFDVYVATGKLKKLLAAVEKARRSKNDYPEWLLDGLYITISGSDLLDWNNIQTRLADPTIKLRALYACTVWGSYKFVPPEEVDEDSENLKVGFGLAPGDDGGRAWYLGAFVGLLKPYCDSGTILELAEHDTFGVDVEGYRFGDSSGTGYVKLVPRNEIKRRRS